MAERPRRWFQLSLTTCIVLMVVAGVLVWANVQVRETGSIGVTQEGRPHTHPVFSPKGLGIQYVQGWPLTLRDKIIVPPYISWVHESPPAWHTASIFLNILIALTLLAATAFLSEYLIRRWVRSKQEVDA